MTCVSQLMQLVLSNVGNSITFPIFTRKFFLWAFEGLFPLNTMLLLTVPTHNVEVRSEKEWNQRELLGE